MHARLFVKGVLRDFMKNGDSQHVRLFMTDILRDFMKNGDSQIINTHLL